jgi:diketogulonate reductase-like aldo/keto reductase
LAETDIVPVVNQIELHPYFIQTKLRNFCTKNRIAIEAYSPLGGSTGHLLDDPVIATIAADHKATPAQIIIRWHLQQGHIVIPKSVHKDRIVSNAKVFDFELNPDEMIRINSLDNNQRIGVDPLTANFTWSTKLVQIAHRLGRVDW